jgi:hypothetical protein
LPDPTGCDIFLHAFFSPEFDENGLAPLEVLVRETPMAVTNGTLIRVGNQVAIRRKDGEGKQFDTLMVAKSGSSNCDPDEAFAMFSGIPDLSLITVDGNKSACPDNLQVNEIL